MEIRCRSIAAWIAKRCLWARCRSHYARLSKLKLWRCNKNNKGRACEERDGKIQVCPSHPDTILHSKLLEWSMLKCFNCFPSLCVGGNEMPTYIYVFFHIREYTQFIENCMYNLRYYNKLWRMKFVQNDCRD